MNMKLSNQPDDVRQSNHQRYSLQTVHYGPIVKCGIFLVLSLAHSVDKWSLQPNGWRSVLKSKLPMSHKFQRASGRVQVYHVHFSLQIKCLLTLLLSLPFFQKLFSNYSHSILGSRVMIPPCLSSSGVRSIPLFDDNTARLPAEHHENQSVDKFTDFIDFNCFLSTFTV